MSNLKRNNPLIILAIAVCSALLFSACSKDKTGITFGKTKWYDDFLFCKYEPIIMERSVCFEYNEDAKHFGVKPTKYALYEKIGEDFKAVKNKEAKLYKNGELCQDNIFETSLKDDEEVKIGIEFTPDADEGTHKYYLKVIDNGGLDRVNDTATSEDDLPLIEEWRAKKVDVMNPLALGLTWFGILLVAAFLLWMIILKRVFYPSIGASSIMIKEPYYSKLNVKGKRQIIFTDKKATQSFLNKLFTGEIIYSVNPVWTTPLILEHANNKKIRVKTNKNYVFDPYGSQLSTQTDYTIENVQTNERIYISVN